MLFVSHRNPNIFISAIWQAPHRPQKINNNLIQPQDPRAHTTTQVPQTKLSQGRAQAIPTLELFHRLSALARLECIPRTDWHTISCEASLFCVPARLFGLFIPPSTLSERLVHSPATSNVAPQVGLSRCSSVPVLGTTSESPRRFRDSGFEHVTSAAALDLHSIQRTHSQVGAIEGASIVSKEERRPQPHQTIEHKSSPASHQKQKTPSSQAQS